MDKFANQNEIKHSYSILLKDEQFFEQDKIDIIECNTSRDIKACPGSGKTTTLLAKLIILANRMPLDNNQGICVLTHTNVAIDEIKSKLGNKADILFRYPNHFGTIQSFVDKFLAIPYFSKNYGKRPMQISNEAYMNGFNRSYWAKLKQLKTNNLTLYNRICSYFVSNDDVFKSIRLTIIDNNFELINIKSGAIIDFKKPRSGKNLDWNVEEKNEMRKTLINIIINVYNYYAVCSYFDAYTLAKGYFLEFENIKQVVSSRFKYLFIDEMQDTDNLQLEMIYNVFDNNITIIQRFGDHHQAIYNRVSDNGAWSPVNPLPISGSKRFGEKIAKVLRTVCIEDNKGLEPNKEIVSLDPILIVFNNPEEVLPKYCEILKTKKIGDNTAWDFAKEEKKKDPAKRSIIKAVGWVGKPINEYNIKSYFREFNSQVKKDKVNYDSLKSFLRKQDNAKIKDYADKIIEAFLHILSIANIKYSDGKSNRTYTKTTLLDYYAKESEEQLDLLRSNISKWARTIHNSEAYDENTIEEIRNFIRIQLCPQFNIDVNHKFVKIFIENEENPEIAEDQIKKNNIFEQGGVQVEVGTIHSVKGETHVATLYIETSYYSKHESERIIEQMKGIPYKSKKGDTHTKETLKMAYVGMSRPKYLLCYAIHSSRNDQALDIRNGGMWEVIYT